ALKLREGDCVEFALRNNFGGGGFGECLQVVWPNRSARQLKVLRPAIGQVAEPDVHDLIRGGEIRDAEHSAVGVPFRVAVLGDLTKAFATGLIGDPPCFEELPASFSQGLAERRRRLRQLLRSRSRHWLQK